MLCHCVKYLFILPGHYSGGQGGDDVFPPLRSIPSQDIAAEFMERRALCGAHDLVVTQKELLWLRGFGRKDTLFSNSGNTQINT